MPSSSIPQNALCHPGLGPPGTQRCAWLRDRGRSIFPAIPGHSRPFPPVGASSAPRTWAPNGMACSIMRCLNGAAGTRVTVAWVAVGCGCRTAPPPASTAAVMVLAVRQLRPHACVWPLQTATLAPLCLKRLPSTRALTGISLTMWHFCLGTCAPVVFCFGTDPRMCIIVLLCHFAEHPPPSSPPHVALATCNCFRTRCSV